MMLIFLPPTTYHLSERRIFVIRAQKVMLDSDLAELYGVPAFRLNEAVKRKAKRFPGDFMFQLTKPDWAWGPAHRTPCVY
jgi:hypothetical protein